MVFRELGFSLQKRPVRSAAADFAFSNIKVRTKVCVIEVFLQGSYLHIKTLVHDASIMSLYACLMAVAEREAATSQEALNNKHRTDESDW
jgi:hypothetical protein